MTTKNTTKRAKNTGGKSPANKTTAKRGSKVGTTAKAKNTTTKAKSDTKSPVKPKSGGKRGRPEADYWGYLNPTDWRGHTDSEVMYAFAFAKVCVTQPAILKKRNRLGEKYAFAGKDVKARRIDKITALSEAIKAKMEA